MSFWLVILAVLPGLIICALIIRQDKYEREPYAALLLCAGMGAAVTWPSVSMERMLYNMLEPCRDTLLGTVLLAFVGLALNEELWKFGVLMLAAYPHRWFNEPLDGIVYAVMIAMGFATLENLVYVRSHGASYGVLRAFTAVPAHFVFALMQGYFAGLAKFAEPEKRRRLLFRGLMLSVGVHGIYDFLILQQWSEWLFVLATFGLYWSLFYVLRFVREHQDGSPFK